MPDKPKSFETLQRYISQARSHDEVTYYLAMVKNHLDRDAITKAEFSKLKAQAKERRAALTLSGILPQEPKFDEDTSRTHMMEKPRNLKKNSPEYQAIMKKHKEVDSEIKAEKHVPKIDPLEALRRRLDDLTLRVQELEQANGDGRKKKKSKLTAEERSAIGIRLQTARAAQFGLTVEQMRALKLRPGQKPTKEQIEAVRKALPAKEETT